MAAAYLMVRAVLSEPADRPRFDRWYETEHLPDAAAAFEARHAWRCWSRPTRPFTSPSTSSPTSPRPRPPPRRRRCGRWSPSSIASGATASRGRGKSSNGLGRAVRPAARARDDRARRLVRGIVAGAAGGVEGHRGVAASLTGPRPGTAAVPLRP